MHRLWVLLWFLPALLAQSAGTLAGRVEDPAGAPVGGAAVRLQHALSGFEREVLSGADGGFQFANLPLQSYVATVQAPGFEPAREVVPIRSNVAVRLTIRLTLARQNAAVEVAAFATPELVEPEATGTRTELSSAAIERMPVPAGTRGLESVLLSFPGFAADANGAIHPRGAHNQMQYVIDGMPVTDQLTGSFGSAVGTSIVQTIELFTGNIPAEFGSKVSGVANITTKSGLGSARRFRGSTEWTAAQFDTLSQTTEFSGEAGRTGYFAALNILKSHRFLDQVSLENLHNGGNAERAFVRLDHQPSERDIVRLNLIAGRSSFELANLRSQHLAGQSQRQVLGDFAVSLGWVHTLGPYATWDVSGSWRTTAAQLFGSPGDTPVTAAQARHLSTLSLGGRFNRIWGPHTFRAGADLQHYPVSEDFSFGITSPHFNRPGSVSFLPTLLAFDLSRGGTLFQFSKKASGQTASFFAQDHFRAGRFAFSLGLRYDDYRFLVNGHQLQPRTGISFHLKETGTVLRVSYNRIYQTPVNENLLLSNSEEAAVLVPPRVRQTLGGALMRIRPERQNVYEAGIQQALGSRAGLNAVWYYKDERDLHDNDNFFNTGIIFPTSLQRSRVSGAELRVSLLPIRKFSGSFSATHYHVVVTPPFTGGLFLGSTAVDLLGAGPFVIDHDQKLGAQANLHYAASKNLWLGSTVRYDSGLVANPSDPAVVARDPDYADLLPHVDLLSHPARVRPRVVLDLVAGYERVREGRRRWDLRMQVANLTGKAALYNFQSIFVGTRLISPRTFGTTLRWFW